MISLQEIRDYYNSEYYTPGAEYTDDLAMRGYRHLTRSIQFRSSGSILDVACGQGGLLALAQQAGLSCHGVDISEKAIAKARSLLGPEADLRVAAAEELGYKENSFDYITCLGSIEHFVDPAGALGRMLKTGKPGCQFVFVVPNLHYLAHAFRREGTQQASIIERLLSLSEWSNLFESMGFSIVGILPDLRPTWWAWVARHRLWSRTFWLSLAKAGLLRMAPLGRQYQFIYHLCDRSYRT